MTVKVVQAKQKQKLATRQMMLILGLKRQFAHRGLCLSTPHTTQQTAMEANRGGGVQGGQLAFVPKQNHDSIWVMHLF